MQLDDKTKQSLSPLPLPCLTPFPLIHPLHSASVRQSWTMSGGRQTLSTQQSSYTHTCISPMLVLNNNIFSSSSPSSPPPFLLLLYALLATTVTQAHPTPNLTARQLDVSPIHPNLTTAPLVLDRRHVDNITTKIRLGRSHHAEAAAPAQPTAPLELLLFDRRSANVTQLQKRTSMTMINATVHHHMPKRNVTTDGHPLLQRRAGLNVTDILHRRNATSFTMYKRQDLQQQHKRSSSATATDHVHNRRAPVPTPVSPGRMSSQVVAQPSDLLVEADDDDDKQPAAVRHWQLFKSTKAWDLADLRRRARDVLLGSQRCRCKEASDPSQSRQELCHRSRPVRTSPQTEETKSFQYQDLGVHGG
ncbi:hypothetical protein L249_5938, partial [Ophiocordyceps polyrhachis-furcata BCC 54312]